jgi:hypothetical protein
MIFSSDSKTFVILSGSTFDEEYTVLIYRLENDEAFIEANFKVTETTKDSFVHEAKNIDVCYEKKEFYLQCGAHWALRLYTYDFAGNLKHT